MRARWLIAGLALVAVVPGVVLAAGSEDPEPRVVADARPERGRALIEAYGCGACHTIAGVPGADARVGPPLVDFGDKRVIGGELRNDPEAVVRWLVDPPAVDPETLMPDLGVAPGEARDIAAYLYSQ